VSNFQAMHYDKFRIGVYVSGAQFTNCPRSDVYSATSADKKADRTASEPLTFT
jgi:hypothetical protein